MLSRCHSWMDICLAPVAGEAKETEMAGAPARRIRRAVEQAMQALAEDRTDDARRALQEARKASEETGIALPDLPPDVSQLWVTIYGDGESQRRKDVRDLRMSDEARTAMIEAGELAADRLRDLMADVTLWQGPRRAGLDRLIPLMSLAFQRAYGAAPAGAQKLNVKPGEMGEDPQERDMGKTLSMMIRRAQSEPRLVDVTPEREEPSDG